MFYVIVELHSGWCGTDEAQIMEVGENPTVNSIEEDAYDLYCSYMEDWEHLADRDEFESDEDDDEWWEEFLEHGSYYVVPITSQEQLDDYLDNWSLTNRYEDIEFDWSDDIRYEYNIMED